MGEIKQGYLRVFTLLLTINYATGKVALTTVQAPIITAELLTGVKVCLLFCFSCRKNRAVVLQFCFSLQFAAGNVAKSTITVEAELAQAWTPEQI